MRSWDGTPPSRRLAGGVSPPRVHERTLSGHDIRIAAHRKVSTTLIHTHVLRREQAAYKATCIRHEHSRRLPHPLRPAHAITRIILFHTPPPSRNSLGADWGATPEILTLSSGTR